MGGPGSGRRKGSGGKKSGKSLAAKRFARSAKQYRAHEKTQAFRTVASRLKQGSGHWK